MARPDYTPIMKHQDILVIGGTGFIGRHIVARLAAQGRRLTVPTRRYDHVRPLILLPTVEAIDADVHDARQLEQLMNGRDAVINLVGILHGNATAFARAHADLPRKIAAACLHTGVKRLLHMSALGAAPDAPSMYLRSKAEGEAAVLATAGGTNGSAFDVTIFRPSVVFGAEDRFLNLFASLQRWFPVIPLAGATARFQPVYVEDVAQAFVNALDARATFGQTYELAGPEVYSLAELVRLAGRLSGHARPIIPLPDFLGRLQALLMEWAPGPTLMSRDNLDSMRVDNVATRPVASELGIAPAPIEQVAPLYLAHRRRHFDRLRARAHR